MTSRAFSLAPGCWDYIVLHVSLSKVVSISVMPWRRGWELKEQLEGKHGYGEGTEGFTEKGKEHWAGRDMSFRW